jgi:hypothetical protein
MCLYTFFFTVGLLHSSYLHALSCCSSPRCIPNFVVIFWRVMVTLWPFEVHVLLFLYVDNLLLLDLAPYASIFYERHYSIDQFSS